MDKNYNFYLLRSDKFIDDIRYIGVTTRKLNTRYNAHKYEAGRNAGRPVYNWWNKRIKEGYKIIIEAIESNFIGDWETREKYWIRHYRQMGFKLLNVSEGGAGVITVEQRTKISRQRSIEAHNKSVVALTKNGEFFKEYVSCRQAATSFNTVPTAITNACKSRWSKSSHGYMWIFKEDYDPNAKYTYKVKETGFKCYKFDLTGKMIITFRTLRECAQTEKIDERRIKKYIKLKKPINNFIYSFSEIINIEEYQID